MSNRSKDTTESATAAVQQRQIRAVYDDSTITVYQAYNTSIATAACEAQRLDASDLFNVHRMTWIKPSWNWMMYRSGYSFKDDNQSNVLALKLKRTFFEDLLTASVGSADTNAKNDGQQVRVQWDPERDVRAGNMGGRIRSIQIGIPRGFKQAFVDNIVEIEDVTERARTLKRTLDENKELTEEDVLTSGLVPAERVYYLPEGIAKIIGVTDS